MATPPDNMLASLIAAGVFDRAAKITDKQRSEIAALLYAKLGARACEMCATTSWAIGDHIVSPLALTMDHATGKYNVDMAASYPSVHLVCSNCGNTKLFNLPQVGFDPFAPVGDK